MERRPEAFFLTLMIFATWNWISCECSPLRQDDLELVTFTNNIEHVIVGLDEEVAVCGRDLSAKQPNPLRIANLIEARFKVPMTRIQLHHLDRKHPAKPKCIRNKASRLLSGAEVAINAAV